MEPVDKVGIVTGGASGIGHASALLLARAGVRVIVADVDERAAADTVSAIASDGGTAWSRLVDVSRPEQVDRLIAGAVAEHGALHILHNCAGIVSGDPDFPDTPPERIAQLIAVNVTATVLATRAAIKAMSGTGGGVIVNMSSTAALLGTHPDPVYGASKAAIKTFTEQCAPIALRLGVRVNAILPGAVETPIIGKTGDGEHPAPWLAPRLAEIELLPADTIAAAVLELVEDDGRVGESVVITNGAPKFRTSSAG